jgi:hypothetical protein
MKQFILVFSMAFLCISAFAQNNATSKVKVPVTLSNSTDKQAPEGKKADVQAKPELEKKTATVTKRRLRAGDVKDRTTPPLSGGQKTAKQTMIGSLPTPPAAPVGNGSGASTPVNPAPPKGNISGGASAPTTRSNLRAKAPVKVPSPTNPTDQRKDNF